MTIGYVIQLSDDIFVGSLETSLTQKLDDAFLFPKMLAAQRRLRKILKKMHYQSATILKAERTVVYVYEQFEDFWDDEIDEVERNTECPDCKGQGGFVHDYDSSQEYEVCLRCGGEGVISE